MEQVYKAGTRTSPLALKQVEEVLESLGRFYPTFKAKIVRINTSGDKDRDTPISEIEGSDFFTREIDQALLKREIDFAIHSAKDLPDEITKGLKVAAITASIDSRDVLVSKGNLELSELPIGAKIGTSSIRRKSQLKAYRDDFEIIDIRGNIGERLKILDNSDLDAILIAAAGLIRLGLERKITQRLSFDIMQPHPYQGALAVIIRGEDRELFKLLNVLDNREELSKV